MKSKNPYGGPPQGLPATATDGAPGPCTHGPPKGFTPNSPYAPPRPPLNAEDAPAKADPSEPPTSEASAEAPTSEPGAEATTSASPLRSGARPAPGPTATPAGHLVYSVIATLPARGLLPAYLAWLTDGHVQAVVAGGALEGGIEVIEGGPDAPIRVRSRYLFADAAAFARYEAEVAPALREDGRTHFVEPHGVTFARETSTLHWRS